MDNDIFLKYLPHTFERPECSDQNCDFNAMSKVVQNLKALYAAERFPKWLNMNVNIAQFGYIDQIRQFSSLIEFKPYILKDCGSIKELEHAMQLAILGVDTTQRCLNARGQLLDPHSLNVLIHGNTLFFFCSITDSTNILEMPSMAIVTRIIDKIWAQRTCPPSKLKYRFAPAVEDRIQFGLLELL